MFPGLLYILSIVFTWVLTVLVILSIDSSSITQLKILTTLPLSTLIFDSV